MFTRLLLIILLLTTSLTFACFSHLPLPPFSDFEHIDAITDLPECLAMKEYWIYVVVEDMIKRCRQTPEADWSDSCVESMNRMHQCSEYAIDARRHEEGLPRFERSDLLSSGCY